MLGKLMKHEFRATARVMGPLYLALLLLAAGANGSARLLSSTQNRFLITMGGIELFVFGLVIVALCVMTLVVMINRFRTNLLGNEGYVTFTLPASVHEQVWSKLLVSTVWAVATAVAVCLASVIAVFRVSYVSSIVEDIREMMQRMNSYYALNGTAFVLELLVLLIVGCFGICLEFYAAMAVGHSFAKHKTLLSVVFFFLFQIVMQVIGTWTLFTTGNSNWMENLFHQISNANAVTAMHTFMGVAIAFAAMVAAVYYFLTTYMLSKHLNLE